MVEFKNLATLEANQDKADALLRKMFGGDEEQGYKTRSGISEVRARGLHEKSFLNRRNRDTNSKRR